MCQPCRIVNKTALHCTSWHLRAVFYNLLILFLLQLCTAVMGTCVLPYYKLNKSSNTLKCNCDNSGRHWSIFQIKLLWIVCSFKVKDHKTGHHWEIKLTSKASHRHRESSSTDLLCNIWCGKMCTLFLPHHTNSLAPPPRNEKTVKLLHGEMIKWVWWFWGGAFLSLTSLTIGKRSLYETQN